MTKPYAGPRRHGRHCFCAECLQDEMNAKDDLIDKLRAELTALKKELAVDELSSVSANLIVTELQAELDKARETIAWYQAHEVN